MCCSHVCILSHAIMKIKITAKFRDSRRLRFEDKKRSMLPKMFPKIFGTFEKRVLGRFSLNKYNGVHKEF